MYIVIDTAKRGHVIVSIFMNTKMIHRVFKAEKEGSLLIGLDKVLKSKRHAVRDIKGIAVVVGAGSFTSARVAVTIGNCLAFVFKIPVIGVAPEWRMRDILEKIKTTKAGRYVSARYSGEPNIGKKKK